MKSMFLALALVSGLAQAGEEAMQLAEGPGRQTVEAHCSMCHSLDYIPMNSPFLDRKGWEASVHKMMKVMGAPIPEKDVSTIVEYLNGYYGK